MKQALAKIPVTGELVLTSEDGILAGLAVDEAQALTKAPVSSLHGGNAAWRAAGHPISTEAKMADEPLDVWLKPYERPNDTKSAMSEYLAWETDLLPRIARDGTTRFMVRTSHSRIRADSRVKPRSLRMLRRRLGERRDRAAPAAARAGR